MMGAVLRSVLTVGLVLLAALPSKDVLASCAPPPSRQQQLADAQSVFVGTVRGQQERGTLVRVEVERVWSGPDPQPRVHVRGGQRQPGGLRGLFTAVGSSTDMRFDTGRRYLFVVPGRLPPFHVDSCSGTTVFDPAVAESAPPDPRAPSVSGLPGVPVATGWPLLTFLAGMAAVAGAVVLLAGWRLLRSRRA